MRRALLAATFLTLPIVAQGQTVNLNLSAISNSGSNSSWYDAYPFGGSTNFLSATGEGQYNQPISGGNTNPFTTNPDGSLTITASPASSSDGNPANQIYNSGAISSATLNNGMSAAGGFSFTYGYYQITAELPAGAGLWPAFWAMSTNGDACEMDVLEAPFNNPTLIQSSLHDGGTGYTTGQVTVPDASTNFNTYGVNWNAQTITYYVNGKATGSTPTPASCNSSHYLIANLAVGGQSWSWPGMPAGETAQMTIQNISYNPNGPNGVGNDGGTFSGGLATPAVASAATPAPAPSSAPAATPMPTATAAPLTAAVGACTAGAASAASVPLFGPGSGPTVTATPGSLQGILSSATPGETIQLASGTYAPFTVSNGGTQGQPITIQAAPGATPIVNAGTSDWTGVQVSANWVTVQGLSIQGQAQGMSLAAAQAAGLGGSTYNTNGITVGTVGGAVVSHVQVLNNTIANVPAGGIVGVYGDYLTVMGNTVTGNAHLSHYAASGISVGFSKDTDNNTGTKNYIVDNTSNDNSELVNNIVNGPGLGITDGSGIIIDDNSNDQNNKVPYQGGTLVAGNTTNNNGGSGVRVYASNNVQVNGNTASGNGAGDIDLEGGNAVTQSGNNDPNCQSTPAAAPSTPALAAAAVPSASAPPPAIDACTAATPISAATGDFTTVNGQIIGPNGQPFIAHGVNVYSSDLASIAAGLNSTLPGTNFIRVVTRPLQDPSTYAAFVNQMTAQGIVVEFEDHPDGGGGQDAPYSGAQLAAESAWYASMAAAYKNNPDVWLGTFNEPEAATTAPGLSAWQQATYDAIRGTGNNNPIMLEVSGSRPSNLQQGLDPSVYAQMTNTIWDVHAYNYQSNYSTDQNTVNASVQGMITAAQTIPSADGTMPVIIGEYGDSTSGENVSDAGGMQEVQAVENSGVGSAAFVWTSGVAPGNMLRNGDGSLTAYGQQVAAFDKTGATAQSSSSSAAQNCVPSNGQTVAAIPAGSPALPAMPTLAPQPAATTPAPVLPTMGAAPTPMLACSSPVLGR